MPTRRRLLRTIVAAIGLGIATTVVSTACCVALGIVPSDRTAKTGSFEMGVERLVVIHTLAMGKEAVAWAREGSTHASNPLFRSRINPPAWSTLRRRHDVMGILAQAAVLPTGEPARLARMDIAYGWPMLAFAGGITTETGTPPGHHHDFGALSNDPPTPGAAWGGKLVDTIPLRPILPGAAVNTAVYALAWLMLLAAVTLVRQHGRLRRGECLACGYSRRGIGADAACPECGTSAAAGS